jgi:flagella basal body P-ring formation protein FlgA
MVISFVCVIPQSFAATITLKGETSVAAGVVRLSDIASVGGTESADQLEALRSVIICAAPAPSESHILGVRAVAAALLASGADLSTTTFDGATEVLVSREYDLIEAEEIRKAFVQFVSAQTGWETSSFLVKPPKNLAAVPVPSGAKEIVFETGPGEDFQGSVLAHVLISIDNEPYRRLSHRFDIERYVEALVAARKIPRGQPISESDIKMARVEQLSVSEESLTEIDQVVGLMPVRTIHPGVVLDSSLLATPPVIEKGQYAAVVWEGNGFNVMTRGRVLEDGSEDEMVRVRLPSRKIVRARVVDSGKVVIANQGEVNAELE